MNYLDFYFIIGLFAFFFFLVWAYCALFELQRIRKALESLNRRNEWKALREEDRKFRVVK